MQSPSHCIRQPQFKFPASQANNLMGYTRIFARAVSNQDSRLVKGISCMSSAAASGSEATLKLAAAAPGGGGTPLSAAAAPDGGGTPSPAAAADCSCARQRRHSKPCGGGTPCLVRRRRRYTVPGGGGASSGGSGATPDASPCDGCATPRPVTVVQCLARRRRCCDPVAI